MEVSDGRAFKNDFLGIVQTLSPVNTLMEALSQHTGQETALS